MYNLAQDQKLSVEVIHILLLMQSLAALLDTLGNIWQTKQTNKNTFDK